MAADAEPAHQSLSLQLPDGTQVSARLVLPEQARYCYVLAHGAGAGMLHPFMNAAAHELAALGIATLRYQFPYMERHARRPDPPPLCHATVRAAVAAAARLAPGLPLIAGGRSFGARMTSQAQALEPLPGVRGLAFISFPLHPAGSPSDARAGHLAAIQVPMLFLQGSRDALAELPLLRSVLERLGARATLSLSEDADHSLHVPARSGRRDPQVRAALWQALLSWTARLP